MLFFFSDGIWTEEHTEFEEVDRWNVCGVTWTTFLDVTFWGFWRDMLRLAGDGGCHVMTNKIRRS